MKDQIAHNLAFKSYLLTHRILVVTLLMCLVTMRSVVHG